MPRVLIPVVDGFEEVELVTPVDILRRCGVEVVMAGLNGLHALGSHGIGITLDALLTDCEDGLYDALLLPGGPGTRHLREAPIVLDLVRRHHGGGAIVAAICAAPTVLARAGILGGRRATCYPTCEGDMAGAVISHDPVVIDGSIITSRGAGTAMPFALAVAEALVGADKTRDVARAVIFTE
jgi:protein deglycase